MFFSNKLLYGYMNGYTTWSAKGYKGGLRTKKKKKKESLIRPGYQVPSEEQRARENIGKY